MSKNIIIAKGTQSQTLNNISKIRTNLVDRGTQNWVPEDEAILYANLGEAEIDKNGTYTAEAEELDGFSQVKVNVPAKVTSKDITENGEYKAKADKVDGYDVVKVNVPTEGGEKPPTLVEKDITENGTYDASDDDADGYDTITVNVEYTGVKDYYYPVTQLGDLPESSVTGNASVGGTVYNGQMYAILNNNLYTSTDGTWTFVCSMPSGKTAASGDLVVYNGQMYLMGVSNDGYTLYNQLYVFTGSAFEYVSGRGFNDRLSGVCNNLEYNGLLYHITNECVTFDGTTWAVLAAPPVEMKACGLYNGQVYGLSITNNVGTLYLFNGSSWSEVLSTPITYNNYPVYMCEAKGKLHIVVGLGLLGSRHLSFNGRWVRSEEDIPIGVNTVIAYNNDLYFLGTTQYKATYTE